VRPSVFDPGANEPLDVQRRIRDARQRLLLELARAGQERAFTRLYRELYPAVWRFVAARVRNPADQQDLTSRVFHKLVAALDDYDPGRGSVWTWVMTTSRNVVIDHFRGRRETQSLDEVAETLADDRHDLLARAAEDEIAGLALRLLQGYPDEVQEMFRLRFGLGLSHREIAALLHTSETAVKQRFSRTLRALRTALESRLEERSGHETWEAEQTPQSSV